MDKDTPTSAPTETWFNSTMPSRSSAQQHHFLDLFGQGRPAAQNQGCQAHTPQAATHQTTHCLTDTSLQRARPQARAPRDHRHRLLTDTTTPSTPITTSRALATATAGHKASNHRTHPHHPLGTQAHMDLSGYMSPHTTTLRSPRLTEDGRRNKDSTKPSASKPAKTKHSG